MARDKKRILICGNYGASNLGDEAILAGLITLVKSAFSKADIVAMSSDITATKKIFKVNAIWHFPSGLRSFFKYWFSPAGWRSLFTVAKADLVLLGGGGLFADEQRRAVWIWFTQFWWFWLMRKKVICIAQSVGPLNTRVGRALTGWVFRKAVAVTVRDEQSKKVLEKLGVKKVKVLADPAYAIGYQSEASLNRKKQIVLTVRPWIQGDHQNFDQVMAELIIWLKEKYNYETVFLPFQTDYVDDRTRFHLIAKLLTGKSASLKLVVPEDYAQAIEIIGRSQAVIGMRLHSVIFGVLTKTPFVGISYSKKVRDFIETIGLSEYSLDYADISLENLKKQFEKMEKHRSEIQQKLEKAKLHYTYQFFQNEKILKEVIES